MKIFSAIVVLAAAAQAGIINQGLSAPCRIRLTKAPAPVLSPCDIGCAGEIAASMARAKAWEKYQKEEQARQKARQAEYSRTERARAKAYFAKLDRLLAEKAEGRRQLEKLALRINIAWTVAVQKRSFRRKSKSADQLDRIDRLLNDYCKRLETRQGELYQALYSLSEKKPVY